LIYSSGFTSNLFSENQWRKIVVNWLRASPSVYAFVCDVFWWTVPLAEVHQNGVYEGDQSSLSWRVRRGAKAQTSHIQDSKNSRTTTLTSFNHRTRSISPANGFQCDEREVLQRKVKTAERLLTESCTRVVTRSAR